MNEWAKIILVHDDVRDHVDGDAHVFITFHRRAQIKIFKVGGKKFGVFDGKDAVDEEFCRCEVGGLGADVEWVVDLVTVSRPSDAPGIFFFGPESGDNAEIGGFATVWDVSDADEVDCICPFYFSVSLR